MGGKTQGGMFFFSFFFRREEGKLKVRQKTMHISDWQVRWLTGEGAGPSVGGSGTGQHWAHFPSSISLQLPPSLTLSLSFTTALSISGWALLIDVATMSSAWKRETKSIVSGLSLSGGNFGSFYGLGALRLVRRDEQFFLESFHSICQMIRAWTTSLNVDRTTKQVLTRML